MTLAAANSTADRSPGLRPPGLPARAARRWLPVAGPGLLMLALGLIGSTRPVLSWDEIASAEVAHRSVPQIWRLVQHIDAVFGPYYFSMHLWTALFGDSVLSLRLPSILAMAGAAAVTGELGRRLFGATAGLVAGLLLCALPNMSRYAAEARPYAMACLFSILALLLLYRARQAPSLGSWIAYAAALSALALSSLVAMVTLAGHVVILAGAGRRQWRTRVLPWCAAVAGTLVLASPLVWWGLHQRREQLYWVPPITLGGVYKFPAGLVGSAEVAWLLIGVLLLGIVRPTRPVVEMVAAAALPMVVLGAVSVLGPSFWIDRYLLFVLLSAVIAAAAGWTRIRAGTPALLTLLLLVGAAALPGQIAVRQPTVKNGSDYRTLATVIRQRQLPGDDIVFEKGRTMRTGIQFYLRHDPGRPRDVLLLRPAAETATLTASEYADPVAHLATAGRIWLVAYGRRADPATGRPDLALFLRNHYRRAGLWTAKNGTVGLYTRRGRLLASAFPSSLRRRPVPGQGHPARRRRPSVPGPPARSGQLWKTKPRRSQPTGSIRCGKH